MTGTEALCSEARHGEVGEKDVKADEQEKKKEVYCWHQEKERTVRPWSTREDPAFA